MKLINGKKIAQSILDQLKFEIQSSNISSKLAVIQVGEDMSSNLYVKRKLEDAKYVGIQTEHLHFPISSFQEIRDIVVTLNERSDINGFFIQLPFPVEGEKYELFNLIDPIKDIDGLNAVNLGKIWQGDENAFFPATVLGIIECFKYVASELSLTLADYIQGKNILIVNHSVIVGKPLAGYLTSNNATVTIAHQFTDNLEQLVQKADIIVSAIGKSGVINVEMIKDKTVVIDVGIVKTENGFMGDIDSSSFPDKDIWLTPVPDGIGPLTRAMLLQNTLKAYKLQNHGTLDT